MKMADRHPAVHRMEGRAMVLPFATIFGE